MEEYYYLNKYKLKIVKYKTLVGNGISFSGEPQYPNGCLLGIVASHTPMSN